MEILDSHILYIDEYTHSRLFIDNMHEVFFCRHSLEVIQERLSFYDTFPEVIVHLLGIDEIFGKIVSRNDEIESCVQCIDIIFYLFDQHSVVRHYSIIVFSQFPQ